MILLYGLGAVLLLLAFFLLFSALRLCLNSRQQRYHVSACQIQYEYRN